MSKIELTPTAEKEVKALQLELKKVTRGDSILNENQVQKIFNSTPRKYKYVREGRAGQRWTYVRASYVRRVLDSIFGFNWDFDIETSVGEAFEVAKLTKMCVVKGTLTGRVKNDGKWIEIKKTQFGRAEVKFKKNSTDPLDFGNDMKAAVSDCLKKCASLMGIASDVYEKDEFQEIEIVGADETSEKTKNTEKLLAEAQKTIKSKATKVGAENDKPSN